MENVCERGTEGESWWCQVFKQCSGSDCHNIGVKVEGVKFKDFENTEELRNELFSCLTSVETKTVR